MGRIEVQAVELEGLRREVERGFADLGRQLQEGLSHRDRRLDGHDGELAEVRRDLRDLRDLRTKDREEFVTEKTKLHLILAIILGVGMPAAGGIGAALMKFL